MIKIMQGGGNFKQRKMERVVRDKGNNFKKKGKV